MVNSQLSAFRANEILQHHEIQTVLFQIGDFPIYYRVRTFEVDIRVLVLTFQKTSLTSYVRQETARVADSFQNLRNSWVVFA